MPRQVFSDDLEEKLIALWAEYQTKKSGIMMKRTKKEKEIADKLNLYAKEIGEDIEFSHSIVHNKIDNLKSKAKEHYKKFRRATATGSAVDSTSDEAFDLEKAYNMWANFPGTIQRRFHCECKSESLLHTPSPAICGKRHERKLTISVPQSVNETRTENVKLSQTVKELKLK